MFEVRQLESFRDTLDIRHRVLWPSKPVEFCIVDGDEEGVHFGGFLHGELICVASIYYKNSDVRLRKFATLQDYQGQGFGSKMIHYILEILNQNATGTSPLSAEATSAVTRRKNATGTSPVSAEATSAVTRRKNATGTSPVVTRFWCDARLTAEGFYRRFGMSRSSDIFLKSDVEYIVMEKSLQ